MVGMDHGEHACGGWRVVSSMVDMVMVVMVVNEW
jgi:hypothetical protein